MSARFALLAAVVLTCTVASFRADEREGRDAGPSPARAASRAPDADKIWSAVVLATNDPSPKEPPPALRGCAARLKRVFGYNQFEIIGSAAQKIEDRTEQWLVPSEHFRLAVRARRSRSIEARGGYLLNLQLFHDKRALVDTEAKLAPGSPLVIRGPQYGKGQILFVLQVQ